MAEVQFARVFLATLDRKPVKLSGDFVSDPKKYPSQSPYILPKPTQPFPLPNAVSPSGPAASLTILLKPTKPSPATPNISLAKQDPSQTTILDLKQHYATAVNLDVSKIKILHNKRPASDLKTLRDVLPTPLPTAEAEFGVMILGGVAGAAASGATTPTTTAAGAAKVADGGDAMDVDVDSVAAAGEKASGPRSEVVSGVSGVAAEGAAEQGSGVAEVLGSEAFWGDLKGFLVQRLRDEGEGQRLVQVFRKAAGK